MERTKEDSLFNRPTLSKVPNDVLDDILLRLPVKLLLRFSCISKQWRDLIGNDDVIKSEVSVYSLKSDSWRRIGDFPYYLIYGRVSGVLACGALHWAVSRKSRWLDLPRGDLITAFDLRKRDVKVEIDGMPNCFDSHVCLESLVQPRGGVESAGAVEER
ncbi:hypothetical protein LguiA_013153 [Lonicera macranthoides]